MAVVETVKQNAAVIEERIDGPGAAAVRPIATVVRTFLRPFWQVGVSTKDAMEAGIDPNVADHVVHPGETIKRKKKTLGLGHMADTAYNACVRKPGLYIRR